jgi:putative endonuclease
MDDDARTLARRDARLLGAAAEAFVVERMRAEGWALLARNWVGAGGELDVVARKGGRLRFVEVKARSHPMMDPVESVTPAKQRRIAAAARLFLDSRPEPFDEAALSVALVDCTAEPWSLTWIDDAFDG